MLKLLKNQHLKKIVGLIALVFILGLVFAVPADAQLPAYRAAYGLTTNTCPPGDSIRLQVYLPMESVKTCIREVPVMNEQGAFVTEPRNVYYIESLPAYISGLFTLSIGVLSLGAIVVIMLGGFQYVWAAGNQQKISSAKSMIAGALGGLALALLSYTLLNTINPKIISLQLTKADDVTEITRVLYCSEPSLASEMFSPLELDPPVFDKTQDETECGFPFYIKGAGGNSCIGRECRDNNGDPTGEVCVNGNCKDAIVYGSYNFNPPDKYIDDEIHLKVICKLKSGRWAFPSIIEHELFMNQSAGEYSLDGNPDLENCDDSVPPKYGLYFKVNDSGGVFDWFPGDDPYFVAPRNSNNDCDRPVTFCKNSGGDKKAPNNLGICPADFPDIVWNAAEVGLGPVWYSHPWLLTEAEIKSKKTVCNINITETWFPEDYGNN